MDNVQYIFLDLPTLKSLIGGRGSKDRYRVDELVVAVMLCRLGEKSWGTECAVGFPLKNTEINSIPLKGSTDIEGLKKVLNEKIEQADDVDALIVKHTPDSSERTGQGFQIKRFNAFQTDLSTDGIIQFINELIYPKTETALVILLETGEPTEFKRIRKTIDFSKFPFSALYFAGVYGDILKFIEVWPNLSKQELDWHSI